jgi:cobalt-zinc-cadmium efflux system outer membrane protein
LLNNPELAAIRQQHGIAAAGVVIARTYPYNPTLESRVQYADGPAEAGVTNHAPTQHILLLPVELRGQGQYRREAAGAALSRTDWEIAFQETALAVRVMRAFNTSLYREEKARLTEETIRLLDQASQQVQKLVEQGRLRGADLILARSEIADVRSQLDLNRALLETARVELYRTLGLAEGSPEPQGTLESQPGQCDAEELTRAALERRADLRARQAAVAEANARVELEAANRYGNPSVGPAYAFNETRVHFIGPQVSVPLPLLNTRKGEILQREAERTRAVLELQQVEVQVRQDVRAALTRLKGARTRVDNYRTQILPDLRKSLEGMERLFAQGEPGVDVLRLIDTRRKLLRAREGYLDALFEMSQAQADLASAVGELALAFGPCPAHLGAPQMAPPQP